MCTFCDKPSRAGGLCNTHRVRAQLGIPMNAPIRKQKGWSFERLSVPVSYDAVHTRCKTAWGKASNHPCVGCGDTAREWAYDGTDPTELVGFGNGKMRETTMRYSLWIEFYMPMCRKCHAIHDHGPAETPSDQPPW